MGYLQEYYEVNDTQDEDAICEWETKQIRESIANWALNQYRKVVMVEFDIDDIYDEDIFDCLVEEQLFKCAICESSGVLFDWKKQNSNNVWYEYLNVHRIIHENDDIDDIEKLIKSWALEFYKKDILFNVGDDLSLILSTNIELLDNLIEEKLFECAIKDSNEIEFDWNDSIAESIISKFFEIKNYFNEIEQTTDFRNSIIDSLKLLDFREMEIPE